MKNKRNIILYIVSICLFSLLIFKLSNYFNNYQELKKKNEEIFWKEEGIRLKSEFYKTNDEITNSINGNVVYNYTDSSKAKKRAVYKNEYKNDDWSLFVNNDSVKVQQDTIILVFSILGMKYKKIQDINIFVKSKDSESIFLNEYKNINTNSLDRVYSFVPKEKGIYEFTIEIKTLENIQMRKYSVIAY